MSVVLGVTLLLAACSSGGGNTSNSKSAATPTTTAGLEAAANAEGEVVLYTSSPAAEINALAAQFNKQYPKVKLVPLRADSHDLLTRVFTEQRAGKYNADVISASNVQISQLIVQGALEKYDPTTQQPIPSGFGLPAGYTGVNHVNSVVFAYNPSALKAHHVAPPTTWEDFTKPEWKGHFSMVPDSLDLYHSLITVMGHDQALDLMKQLGNNSPVLSPSPTEAITKVQSGDQWAAVSMYGPNALGKNGKVLSNVAVVNPSPLPVTTALMDLAKNAPHPDAGKLLLNWFASKAGQQALINVGGYISLRTDVNNIAAIWNQSKWKPVWPPAYVTPTEYNKELKEYDEALHVSS